jgi:RimJ/RimL family protein N-acetyltransferase
MTESDISFHELAPSDRDALVEWLAAETWPFHGNPKPDPAAIARWIEDGFFASREARTFWIVRDGAERVGLVRLFDLEDETALFDLRLREVFRGQGIGGIAVAWLTRFLFTTYPHLRRVEAQTRHDNRAMRVVLRRCGFVKEAHYRAAWPAAGPYVDGVGYAILREDWTSGASTQVRWNDEPA